MSMFGSNSSSTTQTTGVFDPAPSWDAAAESPGSTSFDTGEISRKIARNTIGAGLSTVSSSGTGRVRA